jgi:hypothetical protein
MTGEGVPIMPHNRHYAEFRIMPSIKEYLPAIPCIPYIYLPDNG